MDAIESTPDQHGFVAQVGFASCDGMIGPFAHLCRHGRFDFTLLFEQCFFALLPSILFILFALNRLTRLWRAKPVTLPSSIIYLKLGACAVLGTLQIIILAEWVRIGKRAPAMEVSIGESVAGIVATMALALLTHQEQRRSIAPSTTITAYLLVSILFDGVRCRTFWLIGTHPVAAYFTASVIAKFTVLCLENQSKRSILMEDWRSYGREATSGLLSRSVLLWANDVLIQGHKSFLAASNLYGLRRSLRSHHLLDRMNQYWISHRQSGKRALFWNLLVSCKSSILISAAPRIGQAICKVADPFLVSHVITYVQQQHTPETASRDAGYALIAGVALVCVLRRIMDNFYDQGKLLIKVEMRGSLISTMMSSATVLEPGAKEGSAVLTLITTDVDCIMATADSIHEFWIIPIEVVVAAWLLARQVGVGAVGPAIAFATSGLLASFFARFMGAAQNHVSESVQRRVGDTSTILRSIKENRMLGLVDSCETALQGLMENQIVKSRLFRGLFILLNTAGYLPDRLAPTLTFGIAILAGSGKLDLAQAFTSLAIMQLVLGPLAQLTSSVPFIFTALTAAERLQRFIEASEDNPRLSNGASNLSYTDESPSIPVFPGKPTFAAQAATVISKWTDEPVLKDMSFTIEPGSFTAIAGKVGSGKSLLLRAMLGQLPCSGALLRQTSNVAYCAQTTWLVSASVRQNIIGQSRWDKDWYNTVVTACALIRDFQELADGDSTLVGSNGASLSGGQQQRISLARAVYSRDQVVVIDDILSGLDWETQRHVWKQVFSENGLLRQNGTTLVLATQALHLVRSPDSVILLGDTAPGSVIQGTLDELKAKTNIQQLISRSQQASQEHEVDAKPCSEDSTKNVSSVPKGDGKKRDLLPPIGDISLYKFYFDTVGWGRIVHCVFAFIVFAVLLVLPDIWLKIWTEANSTKDVADTAFWFGIFALLGIGSLAATAYVISLVLLDISPAGIRNIHKRLLATVMRAPWLFFVATDTGDLINRFTRDLSQVDLQFPLRLFFLARGIGMFISSTALVVSGSYFMVIVILPMLVFVYYLQEFYLKTSRQLRLLDLEATAPLCNHFIETIDGAATIQAFGWESAFRSKGLELLDSAQKPYYTLRIIQIWLEVVIGLFVAAMTVLLIALCVAVPSSTNAGAVALAFTHVLSLGGMLSELIQSWTGIEAPLGSIERLRSFENNTPREEEPKEPQAVESAWPSEGHLELNSVTASYKNSDNTLLRALDEVTVVVQPGQKVGICGRTGSGKSSLLLTLFRLLDLNSGSIVLDGVDIANIPRNLLRSRLIAVPQEPKLLLGTLRANLNPVSSSTQTCPAALDKRLIECLQKVELWEYISARGGLDSAIADLELSEGQKQLVHLARAIAQKHRSRILILDEVMSAVDQVTEDLMVKILKEEFTSHTVISVVHRLNTIREFDTVILLDRGEVVETGSPKELLEKEGGRFRALWNGNNS